MRNDSLQQFLKLRRELAEEKSSIEQRLKEINSALGDMPSVSTPSTEPQANDSSGPSPARKGRKKRNGGQSLRDVVVQVLGDQSMTKAEILDAVKQSGYKFSTKNPMNSLGVILYGKDPKFSRVDGRFSLGKAGTKPATTETSPEPATGPWVKKRGMSASGRARIAEAQRQRWAKDKANASTNSSTESTTPPKPSGAFDRKKRKMSPEGRKAIAESSRKRWAEAKASGKSSL